MRYEAFISYSHRDKAWARWLQNALERYRLPKALRDQNGRDGDKRLRPFFRDDTELASSEDLTAAITQAMEQSAALIVICSPHAAASRWTNREIRAFREIAPGRPILPLIVEGSPERDAPDCAFPEAMLFDDAGNPRPEPLAADLRPGADGKRGAQLKLIAGLLGVGVDALRQRDQQRRMRVMGAITAGAMAVSVVTITLAILAVQARNEADVRRGQAESLIDFMLVDLRDRLQPIGRLDVLDAVGDEAAAYFATMGTLGTDEELLKRAMSLRQLGEVHFARRDLPAALEAFEESRELTAALLARKPSQLDYLFEQSQAEFWVGNVAWEANDLSRAEVSFQRYHDYSLILLESDPGNVDFQMEMVYALTNLGALARANGNANAAIEHIQGANQLNEQLMLAYPDDDVLRSELAQGYSWEGSALLDRGDLVASDGVLEKAEGLLSSEWHRRDDMRVGEQYAYVLGIRANVKWHLGQVEAAGELLDACLNVFSELTEHDRSNRTWERGLYRCQAWAAEVGLHLSDSQLALLVVDEGTRGLESLFRGDVGDSLTADALAESLCIRSALLLEMRQVENALRDAEDCLRIRRELSGHGGAGSAKINLARALDVFGSVLVASGKRAQADGEWSEALALFESSPVKTPASVALRLHLAHRLEEHEAYTEDHEWLRRIGFKDPRYFPTRAAVSSNDN